MAIIEEIYHNNMTSFADDGSDFNIFEVLGIEHDEVKICRLLADLLNPNGRHGQGNRFLYFFLKRFFKGDDYNITRNCFVCTQEQTDTNRFIDISITDSDFYIPFEVKFLAKDLENQCNDYIEYALKEKKNRFKKLIYITPSGNLPDKNSCSEENKNYILCISFYSLCDWLRECQTSIQENSILYKNIHQLICVINQNNSKYDEKIKDIFDEVYKTIQNEEKNIQEDRTYLQEINREYFRILCLENGFNYEVAHGKGLPYLYKFLNSEQSDNFDYFWLRYNGQCGFSPTSIGKPNNFFKEEEKKGLSDEMLILKELHNLSKKFKDKIESFIKENKHAQM